LNVPNAPDIQLKILEETLEMSKQQAAPRKAISLPAIRTLGQEPLYNLETTVRNQYDLVQLLHPNGEVVATVVSKNKKEQTKIGSANVAFICAMILGTLGGRGDSTGGAAIWVAANAKKLTYLNEYTLIAKAKSRGGTYEAPVPMWMKAAISTGELIKVSVEKHPIPKRVRETKTGDEEEEIDVWL
jgi:hypothetical protein